MAEKRVKSGRCAARGAGQDTRAQAREMIVFKDGTCAEITNRDGKYLYCRGTQYRILNPTIARIERVPDEERE